MSVASTVAGKGSVEDAAKIDRIMEKANHADSRSFTDCGDAGLSFGQHDHEAHRHYRNEDAGDDVWREFLTEDQSADQDSCDRFEDT